MQVLINNADLTKNVINGSVQITLKANGVRSASLSLFDFDSRVKDGSDLKILRNNQLLFGGIIKSVNGKMMTNITDEFPIVELNITSDGYNYIATRRVTSLFYSSATCATIVNALLQQLASDFVTAGTIQTGPTLTNYGGKFKTFKEVLDELASAAGGVWYIDDNRRLQFVDEQGWSNCPFELEKGGSFTDFSGLSWSGSLENYANRVFVVGGDGSDGNQVTLNLDDPAEIAERTQEAGGLSSGIYGAIVQDSNLRSQFWANQVANSELRKRAIRQSTLTFSSYTAGWRPAQRLKVQIPQITGFGTMGPANIWYYLIDSVDINFEAGGLVRYTVNATRRKDGNFTTKRSAGFREYFEQLIKKG